MNLTLVALGEEHNADQITWPLGMRLYLPKKWAGDDSTVYETQQEEERYARLREETGIPGDIGFRPKYVIGGDLIEAAAPTVSHACVVADSGYSKRGPLRQRLRALNESYVFELEPGRQHMIPEDTELIEPGPTPGHGPARQYLTIPESVTLQTAGDIAATLTDTDWSQQASAHYLNRTGRSVQTIQATFLVDTAEGAVLDLHCSTNWPSGMQIGPKVALRNAGDLRSLAADKGYDDMSFREALRAVGVRPLIKHRVFAPYDHAHNARIDDERYHQRSLTESVNSSLKRSHGSSGQRNV